MDQNTPVETGAPMPPMPEEKTSVSSILSIIVIVLVLAAGAFYFFKQVPVQEVELNTPAELQEDATLTDISAQGTSTDIADIEADLNASDYSGVDAGLSEIGI